MYKLQDYYVIYLKSNCINDQNEGAVDVLTNNIFIFDSTPGI